MATYYVRTDGNDTNDGLANSAAQAWLTITKAINTMNINGGDTTNVVAGTYAGTITTTRAFLAPTVIQSLSGSADDTILEPTNTSSTTVLTIGTSLSRTDNIEWKNLSFNATSNTQAYVVRIIYTTSTTFTDCKFLGWGGAASVSIVGVGVSGASTVGDITLTNPYIRDTAPGANKISGFITSTNKVTGDITITNPDIIVTGAGASYGLSILSALGVNTITGGSVHSDSSVGLIIGSDSVTSSYTKAKITGTTISSNTSHACLMGYTRDCEVDDITVNGGDYGFIWKNSYNGVATNITVTGGTSAATCFKAAVNCKITGSTITASVNGSVALRVERNLLDPSKSSRCIFTDNDVTVTGTADIFDWGNSTDDEGGGICENNTYHLNGTGDYGEVYGTTGIATLAALRTAWAAYPSRSMIQATAANKLTYKTDVIGTYGVVRGDDGIKNLGNVIDLISTGNISFFAVTKVTSFNAGGLNYLIDNSGFQIRANDTNNLWNVSSDGSTMAASATNSIVLTRPVVLIVTRTLTGVVNIYINGVLSGTADQASGEPPLGLPTYFGNITALDKGYVGDISEWGVFIEILSAAKISNLSNKLMKKYKVA